jgi:chaperonin GroES
MKLRPMGDRVVVQPIEQEKVTASGILLPDTSKEKPQEGKVLAVGPGRLLENGDYAPLDIKEGDRVIYSKYSGTEFKQDGQELLVLSERDVLAVIN